MSQLFQRIVDDGVDINVVSGSVATASVERDYVIGDTAVVADSVQAIGTRDPILVVVNDTVGLIKDDVQTEGGIDVVTVSDSRIAVDSLTVEVDGERTVTDTATVTDIVTAEFQPGLTTDAVIVADAVAREATYEVLVVDALATLDAVEATRQIDFLVVDAPTLSEATLVVLLTDANENIYQVTIEEAVASADAALTATDWSLTVADSVVTSDSVVAAFATTGIGAGLAGAGTMAAGTMTPFFAALVNAPPVIIFCEPPLLGGFVAREEFVCVDVVDDKGRPFDDILIEAVFPSGRREVVYTLAGGFTPDYRVSGRQPVSRFEGQGWRFAIRQTTGWVEHLETLRVSAVDSDGVKVESV